MAKKLKGVPKRSTQAVASPSPASMRDAGSIDPGTAAGVKAAINKQFEMRDAARAALTTNLADRTAISMSFAKRAQTVFSEFSASRLPDSARAAKTFLGPGGDLRKAQSDVIARGIASRQKPATSHTLRLVAGDALKKLVAGTAGSTSGSIGSIDPNALLNYINSKSQGLHYGVRNTLLTQCEAEIEAKRRMDAIQGTGGTTTTGGATSTAGANKDPLANLTTDQLIKQSVDTQMATATPPEVALRYTSPDGSAQMQQNIQSFELRSGPSDVTSYHDFNNLQIAFESVWTEVFDQRIKDLGQQLYQEYVKLKDFTGTDTGNDSNINSVAELQDLMAEIQSFADTTIQNVGPIAQGTGSGSSGSGTSGRQGNAGSGGNVTPTEVILDILNPVQGVIDLFSHLF